MAIYIAHSPETTPLANRLKATLRKKHISTIPSKGYIGSTYDSKREIERAMKSADTIVVLVDPKDEPDDLQRDTWKAALEAGWEDPNKRLVPLLIKDAKMPSSLRSKFSPDQSVQVIRVQDPKHDWNYAVNKLVSIVENKPYAEDNDTIAAITAKDKSQQSNRLSYIVEAVKSLNI
jgi:hypothetical protein